LPFTFGNWNIIGRTIAPLIYIPRVNIGPGAAGLGEDTKAGASLGVPSTLGLGDINQSFYLSPAAPSDFIWGVGPSFNLPTATSRVIGSGKFSIGPTAVGLIQPKPWVIGMLVRELNSVAGPNRRADISQTLLQPFINYNFPGGWIWRPRPSSPRTGTPIQASAGAFLSVVGEAKSSRSVASPSISRYKPSTMSDYQEQGQAGRSGFTCNFYFLANADCTTERPLLHLMFCPTVQPTVSLGLSPRLDPRPRGDARYVRRRLSHRRPCGAVSA
jgi:hypothetical protein